MGANKPYSKSSGCEWEYNVKDSPEKGCIGPHPLTEQVDGDHYSKLRIQPVEYCFHNNIPAIEAAVIKYCTRHKDKGGASDIKKAIHLLRILLKLEYNEE